MTSEALEEYLEDVLLSREGIELNLSVTISDQFSRLPATDGASIGFLSEAQEEQSPDLAVINATRERLAASARGNGPVPGPDTRNEKPPSTEGGRFLG